MTGTCGTHVCISSMPSGYLEHRAVISSPYKVLATANPQDLRVGHEASGRCQKAHAACGLTFRFLLEGRLRVEDAEGAHELAEVHHVVLLQVEQHEQLRAQLTGKAVVSSYRSLL